MSIALNSNLLLCFVPDNVKQFSGIQNTEPPEVFDFEIDALLSLYKSLDLNDRLLTIESMLIKSCRK